MPRSPGLCPVIVVLLALAAPAQRVALAQPAADVAVVVDSIVESIRAERGVPGVTIAVARGGDVLLAKGYGYADVENRVPAAAETVYRIGSITKQFTAAAVLRLVERGQLGLEQSLGELLPDFPTQGRTVTVRQLLNHTSGIRSYTGLGPRWLDVRRLDYTHDEMIALIRDEPFDFEPGTQYRYNNSGYYLLGLIIERVSGMSYEDFLATEFVTPLVLSETRYCDTRRLIARRAQGYSRTENGVVNAEFLSMLQPFAAGALCSTVLDLVSWTRQLAGGLAVALESYGQMTTPGRLADGSAMNYGFGLIVTEVDGRRRIAHGGGINGFNAMLTHYPDEDLVIVVLTNADFAPAGAFEAAIAAALR